MQERISSRSAVSAEVRQDNEGRSAFPHLVYGRVGKKMILSRAKCRFLANLARNHVAFFLAEVYDSHVHVLYGSEELKFWIGELQYKRLHTAVDFIVQNFRRLERLSTNESC
jgi:hypothetical protein